MQLTLLGSAVVLLVLWLFVRNRGQSKKTAEPEKPKATADTAFHAVSIKFDAKGGEEDERSPLFIQCCAPFTFT